MMSSVRTYHITESIVFRKTKEAFGGLSNMAAGYSMNIHDVLVPTSEHIYQACRFPYNPELQWAIINEASPMKAKWIAKANLKESRPDWDQTRFMIMEWAIRLKLSQNWDSFSELLLSTAGKYIVEGTPKDKIWGAVGYGDIYKGTNALGRLLMKIRQGVIDYENFTCVEPAPIPNFLFLGRQINTICFDEEMDNIRAGLYDDVTFDYPF